MHRFFVTAVLLIGWLVAFDRHQAFAGWWDNPGFSVAPQSPGVRVVRQSVEWPLGAFHAGQTITVRPSLGYPFPAATRVVSWYPEALSSPPSARRTMVTFPFEFKSTEQVGFLIEVTGQPPAGESVSDGSHAGAAAAAPAGLPVGIVVDADSVRLSWRGGRTVELKLVAPPRTASEPARVETVESNAYYLWERHHFADHQWPRIVECRIDSAGTVVLVAHLLRGNSEGSFAPEIGWEFRHAAASARLQSGDTWLDAGSEPARHSFSDGLDVLAQFDDRLFVHHPLAKHQRRGDVELNLASDRMWNYRYCRCRATDQVPMQPWSWRRAEIVFAPAAQPRFRPTLEPNDDYWTKGLYRRRISENRRGKPADPTSEHDDTLAALRLKMNPLLESAVDYHQLAIASSAALGDDFGNITGYSETAKHGGPFGMNRLNHAAAIVAESRRHPILSAPYLLETAINWCDNFHDLSIWWGEPQRGGTRYNNLAAMGKTPPTQKFMWRSDSAVSFCTKGFHAFWLAWEETGDPRYKEALDAQVAYACEHVHADQGECRNVGIVRDFVRLYHLTGETKYRDQALRLFRELRGKLSPNKLFDQGGKPIDPDPPYIEEDQRGLTIGFAKPYIVGYALAGLPELIALAPEEPDLEETVRAVADFLAATVDPVGGWRYPHPRSSSVIISQGLEHAWQLTQAARALGPEPRWLDAIEIVLRARILAWQRTGKILSGLAGWEISTGKVKEPAELYELYRTFSDRDPSLDYSHGKVSYGTAPPEGIVYFTDVLDYYLHHRTADRLLAPPKPDEPLGQILARSMDETK